MWDKSSILSAQQTAKANQAFLGDWATLPSAFGSSETATLENYNTRTMENINLFDNATHSHLMGRCRAVESHPNTHFTFINSTQLC